MLSKTGQRSFNFIYNKDDKNVTGFMQQLFTRTSPQSNTVNKANIEHNLECLFHPWEYPVNNKKTMHIKGPHAIIEVLSASGIENKLNQRNQSNAILSSLNSLTDTQITYNLADEEFDAYLTTESQYPVADFFYPSHDKSTNDNYILMVVSEKGSSSNLSSINEDYYTAQHMDNYSLKHLILIEQHKNNEQSYYKYSYYQRHTDPDIQRQTLKIKTHGNVSKETLATVINSIIPQPKKPQLCDCMSSLFSRCYPYRQQRSNHTDNEKKTLLSEKNHPSYSDRKHPGKRPYTY